MSKYQQCYYVIGVGMKYKGMFGYLAKNHTLTVESFVQCNSLKEAKKIHQEKGGIILKGVREL